MTTATYFCCDLSRDYERMMRKAENHAALMQFLGARLKGLQVQWWPVGAAVRVTTRPALKPLGIWAGVREGTRGRHHNWRLRRGRR